MKSIVKIGLFVLPAMILTSCRGNYDAVAKREANIFNVASVGDPTREQFTCVNYYIRITSINKQKEKFKKLNELYFTAKNERNEEIHCTDLLDNVHEEGGHLVYFQTISEIEIHYDEEKQTFTKVSVGFQLGSVNENCKFYCNNYEVTTEEVNIKI